LGNYQPHPDLGKAANLREVEENDIDRLLAGEAVERLSHVIQGGTIVSCWGSDLARQEAAGRLIAARERRPLLQVTMETAAQEDLSAIRLIRLVQRDARLLGAIPFITGWDVCLGKNGAPPTDLVDELCLHPGTVIVSGTKPWQPRGVDRMRNIVSLEFSIPVYSHRLATWQGYLGEDSNEGELDVVSVAGQFVLTASQTRDAIASARDRASQRGTPLETEDLFAAARLHSSPRLAGLARKINPRFGWEDIVLPVDRITQLREIVNTVRMRPQVLEEWGVGKKLASSSGVTVLFAGEPGTGKTMAAEIIARELGLDLYKIDLSSVVSKYIGETEKNLERIFDEAESSNAILFFDEADALFGKRSEVKDAHDRYANIEISYLLQRMEAYDGVTILATNLRANLDEAFTRRLQFAVDFPFPEENDRLRIWSALFPASVPKDKEIDFSLLAQRFKMAGGNIRNVIVSAAYLAASDGKQVTMSHLMHGTRRELQKMGRLIDETDFVESHTKERI
jgi:SpoVK/Ycf46/Vps4 family AAA+-type ATPase